MWLVLLEGAGARRLDLVNGQTGKAAISPLPGSGTG
jgi:hypothetical protein